MKKILFFIFISIALSACNLNTNAIYNSDKIDDQTKEEIETLRANFYKAVIDKDEKKLKTFLSPQLLLNVRENNTRLLALCTTLIDSNLNNKPILVDEFLVKGKANTNVRIPRRLTDSKEYSLYFGTLTKKSYLLLLKRKLSNNYEILITFIFGKYSDGWKINYIHGGDYSFDELNAPQRYLNTLKDYEDGHLVNAHINMHLTEKMLQPGGDIFSYRIKKKVNKLQKNIATAIEEQYSFPTTIEEIETKPEIFQIAPEHIENTYSPMVHYLSTINLEDTVELRLEYEQIKTYIPNYFKGINDNKYVCYKALNKIPEEDETVDTFGFIDHR